MHRHLRHIASLTAFTAFTALPLIAQTTCTAPIGIYPEMSSILLNGQNKSSSAFQTWLRTNSTTPISFTVSNIQSAGGWLAVYPTFGTQSISAQFSGQVSATSPLEISVAAFSISTLVSGQQYTGQFTVTPSVGSPVVIPVTLNLGPDIRPTPVPVFSPNCVSFTQPGARSQAFFVVTADAPWGGVINTATDPITNILSLFTSNDHLWLDLGTVPGNGYTVELTAAAGLLSSGVYSGKVNLNSSDGRRFILPVTLSVTQGLTFSASSLQFNTSVPSQKTLTITGGSGSYVAGVVAGLTINPPVPSTRSKWLSISGASSFSTPASLTVSVDPTGMAPGVYAGEVDLMVGNAYRRIPVTLTVPVPAVVATGNSGATLTELTFTVPAGGTSPTQQVQVSGVSGATGVAFAYNSNAPWLLVGGSQSGQATTPAALAVGINAASLAPGAYQASLSLTPTGGQAVTLQVSANVVPSISAVTNAASFLTGPVAPGEIITIFGSGLGPPTGIPLTPDLITNGQLPKALGGVQALIGGFPAPLLYVGAAQISAIVPYEISAPIFVASPSLQVSYAGQLSSPSVLQQIATSPAIFTTGSKGTGQGAILNSDLSVNSSDNPAHPGDIVVLYMTGGGQTSPAGVTGKITPAAGPYPQPLFPPTVTIGGQTAQLLFYGEAPGQVSGLMQINVQVPSTVSRGDVPVVVALGASASQSVNKGGTVTLAVK